MRDFDDDAPGAEAAAGSKLDAPEPDTRYAKMLLAFESARRIDPYAPTAPTHIARSFNEGREIPEERVRAMFEQVLTSPLVPRVAALIEKRLGRPLEPFDVWYDGFRARGAYTEAQLDEIVKQKYPTPAAFERDIPNILVKLGFSKEHRDINIRRIGYVASEITKNGGIAICAPIAPYDATRKHVRQLIDPYGGFILVHVATPIETCEERDRKGLYAKARAGIVKEFTGISDPYEVPTDAEVVINTAELSAEESAQEIILHLEQQGFIGVSGDSAGTAGA